MKPISKSQFMDFLRHPRLFWDSRHDPLSLPKEDPMEKALASQSEGVEVLSRQLHPGGLMLDPMGGNYKKAHQISMNLVADKERALFQPTFSADDLLARVDILYKNPDDTYTLREVKSSSTTAGDKHTMDAAFQYNVLTKAGVNVSRVELLLLNRDYVRDGAIDPEQLFSNLDVTDKVIALQPEIESSIIEAKKVDKQTTSPEVGLDDMRIANLSDDEVLHYRPDLRQEDSVLLMPKTGGGRKKSIAIALKLQALNNGDISAAGIDNEVLSQVAGEGGRQSGEDHPENTNKLKAAFRIATSTGAIIFDSLCIDETIKKIKLPAVFIDFETYLSAIPPHDGCRPNDQIPFLVSMIRVNSPDEDAVVTSVIASPNSGDPRGQIAKAVLEGTRGATCLVAYNASFEKTIMKNLAQIPDLTSEEREEMIRLTGNFTDIADPFRQGHFYHPKQYGGTGQKRIVGAILQKNPYEGLKIANGATAAAVYQQATHTADPRIRRKTEKQLKKYCDIDAQCMVDIVAGRELFGGIPQSEMRFQRHARIKVKPFAKESFIDADPRTIVNIKDASIIENMAIDGKDMKKCGTAALSRGTSAEKVRTQERVAGEIAVK
jgi:hypothetical protein